MQLTLHRRWLYACLAAAVITGLVGRFSVTVTAVFIVIYLVGAALIGPAEAEDADSMGATDPMDGSDSPAEADH
jgi:hypothetical protein